MKNKLVLFHGYENGFCPDGYGSAYVAWKVFGEEAVFMAARHQSSRGSWLSHIRDLIDGSKLQPQGTDLYVLDFAVPRYVFDYLQETFKSVTYIDHHESELGDVSSFSSVIIDKSKSAALLTWDYFFDDEPPALLKYISDRDTFQKRLPHCDSIHAARGLFKYSFETFDVLASLGDETFFSVMFPLGEETGFDERNKEEAKKGFVQEWRGYTVAMIEDIEPALASDALNILCRQEDIDFAVGYSDNKNTRTYQLRSIGDFDVSEVARRFGGGGHINAAGFKEVRGGNK